MQRQNPPLYKSNFEWCIQCRRRTVNNTGDETLFFLHFDSIKRVVRHKNTSPFGRITSLERIVRNGGERCRTVLDYWDPPLRIHTQAVHCFQLVLWIRKESHFVLIQNLKRTAWCISANWLCNPGWKPQLNLLNDDLGHTIENSCM